MSIDFGQLVLGPCLDAFANPYQWQSQSLSDPVTINGIFDDGFKGMDPLGEFPGATPVDMTTSVHRLGVRLAAFPATPAQGDSFVTNSSPY